MHLRRTPIVLAVAAAVGVAGCGATTVRHVTTTITRPAGSSTSSTSSTATSASTGAGTTTGSSTTSSTTGARSGAPARSAARGSASALAGRSPMAILVASAQALRRVGGYAMRANLLQDHQRTIVDLSASSVGRFEATTTTGRSAFELIALPSAVFLKGDAAFWHAQSESTGRARTLAGHWIRVPAAGRRSVTRTLGTLAPGTLARCLVEDHGTLTVQRHPTVIAGHRAIVIQDAGNAPGATPSTIAVAATGPPYPLRYVATGLARRGGKVDVCNNGKGGGAIGTITLDQFGETPSISAPTGAQGGAPV